MPRLPNLRAIFDHLEKAAKSAEKRGEVESELDFVKGALMVRTAMATPEEAELTIVNVDLKMRRDMEASHRGSISKAHLDHPMMDAARKVGIESLGDLAKALGYEADWGKGFLSRALRGDKKLPAAKAAKFRELTGKSWKV